MASRSARRRASRLFALYAAASLVPVAILGTVLGLSYRSDGERHALEQGRAQAEVIEQMAISPALQGATPRLRLTTRQRDRLWTASNLAVFNGSISQLRLVAFSGQVVFADNGDTSQHYDVRTASFRRALAGRPDAELLRGAHGGDTTIRVLQPVVTAANGRSVGVLEVRLPYAAIARTAQQNARLGFIRLGLGLLGLYLVLGLISWWTTRSLARHAVDHEHQALHDSLTGLPNRALLRRLAESALAASSPERRGGLVLLDLNRFKEVNDTLGHHAGDELLQVIARRLAGAFRSDDVVARLGGDEFAVLLPSLRDDDEALELLARVRRDIRQDVDLDGVTMQIDASLGLCLFPDDASTVEELLQHADAAMYEGKRGPSNIVKYRGSTARPDTSSLVVQRELAEAIVRDQLFLEYQPQVDLVSGDVVGVEALVRWQHPQLGRLAPDMFVPVAEKSQQIDQLTRWVLDAALRDCATWRSGGVSWKVAVNVSARNLSSPTFVDEVLSALDRHGVPTDRLVLEVTETATPFDAVVLRNLVAALVESRIQVSLDDFGTGVTHLAQLQTTPFSEIKIDRRFVASVDRDRGASVIVASLIEMAHDLGCTVIAEGVETPGAAEWLRQRGCDLGQGFYWSRPVPWRDLRDRADDSPSPDLTIDHDLAIGPLR